MSTLSSRPSSTGNAGSTVTITEDWIIDPPETRIVLHHQWPVPAEMLLVKQAGSPITLYDLAVLFGRLGLSMEYEELR